MTENILYYKFNTQLEEYAWVVREVQRLIDEGHAANEIAIIARRHASLSEMAKYLHRYQLPVYYERGQNVLEKPYIRELLTMLRFVYSLAKKDKSDADELLPEILSYPFLNLSRQDLWRLSVFAHNQADLKPKLWLDVMLQASSIKIAGQSLEDPEKIQQLAEFFIDLAAKSKSQPVQYIFDELIGADLDGLAEDEQEEGVSSDKPETPTSNSSFQTNFKKFYFDDRLDLSEHEITSESVNFLSNLRTLVQAIRQYRSKETLYVQDVLEFISLLEQNRLPLIDNSPFGSQENGVCLLTAHKAKGLEFKTVFIIDCIQEEWLGRRNGTKLDLPLNLPLLPDKDDLDDQLRLLYVSMTRAKYRVYFTTYKQRDGQKEVLPISLLEDGLGSIDQSKVKVLDIVQPEDKIYQDLNIWTQAQQTLDLRDDEKKLLQSILENYRLSVTHLNNFLDVTAGGPRKFLEQNLLHFPRAKTPMAAYGTAMHAAVRCFLEDIKSGKEVSLKLLKERLYNFLSQARLSEKELAEFYEIGSQNLQFYVNQKKDKVESQSKLEFSFANQEVRVGEAVLTGQVDLIEFKGENNITVTDFKTGKPLRKWQDSQNQVKLWRYQNQLIFYKILVENSRKFGGKYMVDIGRLEFLDSHRLASSEIVSLEKSISRQESAELGELAQIVFNKVVSLDFPDTSKYTQDFKGVQNFVGDLLEKKI